MKRRYAHQGRYEKRQIEKRGMIKVAVWIPESGRTAVLELAETLRKGKAHDEGKTDPQIIREQRGIGKTEEYDPGRTGAVQEGNGPGNTPKNPAPASRRRRSGFQSNRL